GNPSRVSLSANWYHASVVLLLAEVARRQLLIGPAMAAGIVVLDFVFSVVVITMLETFAQQPGAL
ncbi:MAG: hypothetical protein O3B74_05530, partial [Proteobacteria bacterium]|nr:hypothetical protein [Pseudomonadota bacterium]